MRHNEKARYIDVAGAMAAADKYTKRYGFKHEWYLCSDCSYYHLTTKRHEGVKVIDLEAIRRDGS